MSDGNLLIESGQRCSRTRGRIAMYEHHIGLHLTQHVTHAQQHTGCHVIQVLPLLHDVEVIVGNYLKESQHLVEHLTVLTCHAYNRLEILGILFECLHQRSHLDSFGASAKYQHHFLHAHYTLLLEHAAEVEHLYIRTIVQFGKLTVVY